MRHRARAHSRWVPSDDAADRDVDKYEWWRKASRANTLLRCTSMNGTATERKASRRAILVCEYRLDDDHERNALVLVAWIFASARAPRCSGKRTGLWPRGDGELPEP